MTLSKLPIQIGPQFGSSGTPIVATFHAGFNIGVDKTGHPFKGVTPYNGRRKPMMGLQP